MEEPKPKVLTLHTIPIPNRNLAPLFSLCIPWDDTIEFQLSEPIENVSLSQNPN